MISNMADALAGKAKSEVDGCPKRNARETMMMSLNMQLAVYVFPAILHYKGKSSQPLADAIGKKWKEVFPKSNVRAAEVEFIEKGFQRKFCYITTAVCESLGRADDCYELTLLRSYRDNYLSSTQEGEKAVSAYYDVAPTIVKHINALEDAPSVYQGIYEAYIQPCIRMIEEGKNQECAEKYYEMVCDMKQMYFSKDTRI